jgi:hypothetical protein
MNLVEANCLRNQKHDTTKIMKRSTGERAGMPKAQGKSSKVKAKKWKNIFPKLNHVCPSHLRRENFGLDKVDLGRVLGISCVVKGLRFESDPERFEEIGSTRGGCRDAICRDNSLDKFRVLEMPLAFLTPTVVGFLIGMVLVGDFVVGIPHESRPGSVAFFFEQSNMLANLPILCSVEPPDHRLALEFTFLLVVPVIGDSESFLLVAATRSETRGVGDCGLAHADLACCQAQKKKRSYCRSRHHLNLCLV